jgi:hypothetical protein
MKKIILILTVTICLISCENKKEVDPVQIVKEYLWQHYGYLEADAVLSVTEGDIPYCDSLLIFYSNYNNAVQEFKSWLKSNNCTDTMTTSIQREYVKQMQKIEQLLPTKEKLNSVYLQPLQMFSHTGTYVDRESNKCKIYIVELRAFAYIGLLRNGEEIFTDTRAILNKVNSLD